MKNIVDSNSTVNLNSNAKLGFFRYKISIKFVDKSNISTQLCIFDAIKKLGAFSIQDQKDHVYILDFKSGFAKDKMEERLKEIAGLGPLFNYTVKEVCGPGAAENDGK